MILQYFPPIFTALALTLLLTPLCIRLAHRFRLVDEPFSAPHKAHKEPAAKAGGIAILTVMALATLWNGGFSSPEITAILSASAIIFLFGLWDDAQGLNAGWKLTGQALGAAVLLWQGIQIQMFASPVLDIAVTLLWIVGVTNAFNLVDSMDGLAVGLAAIAAVFFLLVTIDSNEPGLALLSALALGACIGLFYFNATPARTFLGDSGAQFLGFLLATIAMAYTPRGFPQPSSWFVPILLLSVPIFDTTFVAFSRLRRGLPFYKAGLDHSYHRLTQLGLSSNQSVVVMHVAALLTGCLAFVALSLPPLWANAVFAAVVLCGVFAVIWLDKAGEPYEIP